MKMRFLAGCTLGIPVAVSAQTQAVDTGTFSKWPVVRDVTISNDGRYAAYSIAIAERFRALTSQRTELRDLQGDWKQQLPGEGKTTFTTITGTRFF